MHISIPMNLDRLSEGEWDNNTFLESPVPSGPWTNLIPKRHSEMGYSLTSLDAKLFFLFYYSKIIIRDGKNHLSSCKDSYVN